jgi:FMN-dependent NADH-azoreductase
MGGKRHIIRIYDIEQKYFNYEYHQEWIDFLVASKSIIIPVPMWNFMIPAALKDFFDKTIKRGQLWDIDKEGHFVGLLPDRPAYLIMTSGGEYPAGSSQDFVIPYLRTVLAFVGIKDVKEFRIGNVGGVNPPMTDDDFLKQKTREMLKAFGLV